MRLKPQNQFLTNFGSTSEIILCFFDFLFFCSKIKKRELQKIQNVALVTVVTLTPTDTVS